MDVRISPKAQAIMQNYLADEDYRDIFQCLYDPLLHAIERFPRLGGTIDKVGKNHTIYKRKSEKGALPYLHIL